MASNFVINQNRKHGNLYIELKGDFDGSSAMQLLVCLNNCPSGTNRIIINTDGLKDIHAFGRMVFKKNYPPWRGKNRNIIFAGENRKNLI